MYSWCSITTREREDLIRCNICELKVSMVALVNHLHTAHHKLRKVDMEKELNRVKTDECYENNRSVVSMW